jgi:hypothetical protein
MKVLSIQQPFATLILTGWKQWETRSWPTDYRGPLLIHAARGTSEFTNYVTDDAFIRKVLRMEGYPRIDHLTRGAILGQVQVKDCLPVQHVDRFPGELDTIAGFWHQDWYAWKLEEPKLLRVPIRLPGKPGLWDYTGHDFHFIQTDGQPIDLTYNLVEEELHEHPF